MAIIKHILSPDPTSLNPDEISANSDDFWEFLSSGYFKKKKKKAQDGNNTYLASHNPIFYWALHLSSGLDSGCVSPC